MLMWLRVLFRWLARLALDAVKRVRTRPDKDVVRANQLQAFTESEAGLRQQLDHVRRSEAELRRLLDQTRSALDESEASLEAIHQRVPGA